MLKKGDWDHTVRKNLTFAVVFFHFYFCLSRTGSTSTNTIYTSQSDRHTGITTPTMHLFRSCPSWECSILSQVWSFTVSIMYVKAQNSLQSDKHFFKIMYLIFSWSVSYFVLHNWNLQVFISSWIKSWNVSELYLVAVSTDQNFWTDLCNAHLWSQD